MQSKLLLCALLCLCFTGVRPSARYQNAPSFPHCVTCGLNAQSVTLRVRNVLKEPKFDISLRLQKTYQRFLMGMMGEAVHKNAGFRFSATYNKAHAGFDIDTINSLSANTMDTVWQILDGSNNYVAMSASCYEPRNEETVTFNLTKV